MAADEQTSRDLDAPSPPGSPMRTDAPAADVTPGPEVQPSSTPDGPQVVPAPATPEGEPGPDPQPDPGPDPWPQPPPEPDPQPGPPSQADFENAQVENAGSSLDEPSDASGGE